MPREQGSPSLRRPDRLLRRAADVGRTPAPLQLSNLPHDHHRSSAEGTGVSTFDLFDPPPATYAAGSFPGSRKGSPTSRAAAHSIADEVTARQLDVLKALVVLRTATPDEIASRLKRHPYVVRPRVTELQKRGFITQTGETRITPAGRQAMVVKLTMSGAEFLEASHVR